MDTIIVCLVLIIILQSILIYNNIYKTAKEKTIVLLDRNKIPENIYNYHFLSQCGENRYWNLIPFHYNNNEVLSFCENTINNLDVSINSFENLEKSITKIMNSIINNTILVGDKIHKSNIIEKETNILSGTWFNETASTTFYSSLNDLCRQINESKNSDIVFVQCWAFSSIFCSLMMYLGINAYPVWGKSTRVDINMNGEIEAELDEFTWTYHVWSHYVYDGETYAIDVCPSLCNIKTNYISKPTNIKDIKTTENYFKYLTNDKDCKVFCNTYDITKKYK